MKSRVFCTMIVVVGVALLVFTAGPVAAQEHIAITPVTVVDVTDGSLHVGQTVLVKGNRITAVGPMEVVTVPDDAAIVDGKGGYLIPGLWDMHVHAARAGRAPLFWPLFLAHGVTGFREMGSFVDSLLYWRDEAAHPEKRAPRIYWGAIVDGQPPVSPFHLVAPDAAGAVAAVDSLAELGFDFVKVYDRLPREAYFALAKEAQRLEIPFAGHVPFSVSPGEASDAGQKSFEHVTVLHTACTSQGRELAVAHGRAVASYGEASDSARSAVRRLAEVLAFSEPNESVCGQLLDRMVTNGTWFTPTLTVYQMETQPSSFDDDPRMQHIPETVAKQWREGRRLTSEQEAEIGMRIMGNALKTVALARQAGVKILAGTDASGQPYIFAGSSLHDELTHLVDAGLTTLEALQTATLNPARFMGREDQLGTVEAGKLADLVLLEGNPLEDISNTRRIQKVIFDGEVLVRDTLDKMLEGDWVGVE